MSVQLWERRLGGLADSMVAESFLAVPDVASPPMPDWQMYSFSAERTFTPRAAYQLGAKEDAAADSDLDADVRRLPRRCVSGQLAVSIAWSAQPATHERAARAAEASAAGASSFITAHARGKPSRVHTPRCPARSIRCGWASTCAPTSSTRTLRRTRRCSRCWRAPATRAPRARPARTASPTSSSGCAAARRRSPTARGSSTSVARGRSSGVAFPPTSGSSLRPTPSSRGGCAKLLKPEAQRRGGDDDDDDADERGAKQKGGCARGWRRCREAGGGEATRSYVTQTGDFVREPIADSEQPHRAHRPARPLRSPPPSLSLPLLQTVHTPRHPPPAPARPPATSRAHLFACASWNPSTSTSPSCSSSARRGASCSPAAASAKRSRGRPTCRGRSRCSCSRRSTSPSAAATARSRSIRSSR